MTQLEGLQRRGVVPGTPKHHAPSSVNIHFTDSGGVGVWGVGSGGRFPSRSQIVWGAHPGVGGTHG